jgi:predicted ester cyclase
MSKEENMTLVRRFFEEAYSQGNPVAANEILATDFAFYGPAAGIHGPANFLQFTNVMRNGLAIRFKIEVEIYDGEKASTYSRMAITHQGEFAGLAPTGRQMEFPRIDTFLISEGKIREVRTTMDHQVFMAQLKS